MGQAPTTRVATSRAGAAAQPDGVARWRALGTYVHLAVGDPDALADAVAVADAVLSEVDRTCSRFRPDSELARAARATGPIPASPVLVGAVRVALDAASETDGLVDPTLGDVLVAAGYSRTFEDVPACDPSPVALPTRRAGWRDVVVTDDTLTVPEGVVLDLGATGKAYAADLVGLSVAGAVGTDVVVSVGGDVRAVPVGDSTRAWTVVVGHTEASLAAGPPLCGVPLTSGGLATSSVAARRWVRDGRRWTHLLDPRTCAPVDGPWVTVTALGPTCVAANVASTAAVVLGDAAAAWLDEHGVAARLVARDGTTHRTPEWLASAGEVRYGGGAS